MWGDFGVDDGVRAGGQLGIYCDDGCFLWDSCEQASVKSGRMGLSLRHVFVVF